MPLLDVDGFHPEMLPSNFKKDTKEIIALAVVLGWKVHITSHSSVTIIAPGERKKYHFGMNGRASINHNRIKRDIMKFADPERLLLASVASEASDETGRVAAKALADMTINLPQSDVEDDRPALEEARQQKAEERAERSKQKAASSESEPAHIVSEKPMLAKSHEGRGYESRVAIERRWSDGTTDYKCVDCEYTTPNRLSVRGHRTRADHRKVDPPPKDFKTEVPNAARYAPRQARIDALAAVLAEMPDAEPDAIAKAALMWVHEQSKHSTALADEREPMTAEETLERIKALVDTGNERLEQQRQMEELTEQVEALTTRVEQAETYAIEQATRADKATATLDALRDLVTEATVTEAERKAG